MPNDDVSTNGDVAVIAADDAAAGAGVDPGADAAGHLGSELSGLDQLELAGDGPRQGLGRRIWSLTWPKVAAVALGIGIWQVAVWLEWKPEYALASPGDAFSELWKLVSEGTLWTALDITMRRAVGGFIVALVLGVAVGTLVAGIKPVRVAVGSLITGLQTMPSIAWFPLAILLFGKSEGAIRFVVLLGAAPSIANGLITGIDQIPPILRRAGRVLGARGPSEYWYVVLPAALPSFIGGLKQGWAFAWRSLMAGELLVIIRGQASLGYLLTVNRDLNDSAGLIAVMIAILIVGIAVDTVFFGTLDRAVRRRWGLIETAT
ncbi:MAG TPA: ABC transporter permease [Acidimicrobiales bacterium]|jgi:NitT/TauT family transport system permease protein|nr:ABC transporter permease [Acidimicrobiales bacterium]